MRSDEVDGGVNQTESLGISSGTTTIGLCCADGVVLATERRATMDHFIASKRTIKLFRIDHHLGATLAGSLGDAQRVIQQMQAEASLYRARVGRPIRVEAAATSISNHLNASRYYPYLGWFILGGVDASGPHLFSLDHLGGCVEERFVSIGSGSPFAYGVLDESWRGGTQVDDGVDLALRGLAAAMKRDSASGDGSSVATITDRGYREVEASEVERRRTRLKLA
jgi:proteasome beta subunit